MATINSWPVEAGYTATFGADDFESWWLAGMSREDVFPDAEIENLLANCVYLAQAEAREMTQDSDELREAIEGWQREWNAAIAVTESR